MNKKNIGKIQHQGYFTLLLIVMMALLIFLSRSPSSNFQAPVAKQGVFDMRNTQFADVDKFNLDGEWEFYWDNLLSPDDFRLPDNPPVMSGYFPMHQAWSKFELNGEKLPATGQVTYRLQLLTGTQYSELHLHLFDIHEAYKLWANGSLIAQSGIPGNSVETEVPARSLNIANLSTAQQPIELILQVSNYHFRQGGVIEAIAVALPDTLENERASDQGMALLMAGMISIMGIYHVALFLFRRADKAPLFFGVYCLLVVCYSITSNSSAWAVSALIPWQPSVNMEYFSLACFVCWASFFFRFLYHLYPDVVHKKLVYFLDLRIPIFIFLLLFFPGIPLYWFVALCLLQMIFYACYYIVRIALCIKTKRTGAWFIQLGLVSQLFVGLNDSLTHMGLIDSIYLAGVGICFFVLTQSLALAQRFSQSFYDVERLSKSLESKNATLENEIVIRNALEQKIVNISEEERRKISYELHDGVCQQLTGARLNAAGLAYQSQDKEVAASLTELASQLQALTDNAYKTARGLWPVEHGSGEAGPSLEALVQDVAKTAGVTATFDKHCHCEICTNPNITSLYRIAQEALTNAAKHAQAERINVHLHCAGDGLVTLTVEDDGIGRYAAAKNPKKGGGLGMSIMAHRAKLIGAQLIVEDFLPHGTRIKCIAPCSEAHNEVPRGNNAKQ